MPTITCRLRRLVRSATITNSFFAFSTASKSSGLEYSGLMRFTSHSAGMSSLVAMRKCVRAHHFWERNQASTSSSMHGSYVS